MFDFRLTHKDHTATFESVGDAIRYAKARDFDFIFVTGPNDFRLELELPVPDLRVENKGASVVLVRPLTDFGRSWLEEHTDGQWFGGALAVEPRFLEALVEGAVGDGLAVQ